MKNKASEYLIMVYGNMIMSSVTETVYGKTFFLIMMLISLILYTGFTIKK